VNAARPDNRRVEIQRVILAGFGNVGRNLLRLLDRYNDRLQERYGVSYQVVAVTTGSHGSIVDSGGIEFATLAESNVLGPHRETLDVIGEVPADVMVELTPLDIVAGQPARSYIEQALQRGMHVVTANKGPIAFAYRALADLARASNKRLLFESTVMDGTPVFNLARYGLLGCTVTGFRGVLNSTTNFILGEIERGGTLEGAVQKAQRRGFAEANPSLDIGGWDAAFKTTVLANVLLGADLQPHGVNRTGIADVTSHDVAAARASGQRIKLVCDARWTTEPGAQIRATVAPVHVPLDDPLAQVEAASSALILETDLMGDIAIVENDPTLVQTAYGVLNDLLEIALAD